MFLIYSEGGKQFIYFFNINYFSSIIVKDEHHLFRLAPHRCDFLLFSLFYLNQWVLLVTSHPAC